MEPDGTVRRVKTDQGDIDVEQVVVGVGPWIESLWEMLGLSHKVDVRTPEGEVHENQHMWTYWYLQEGEIDVDPKLLSLEDGSMPPVLHVDSDAPLYDDEGKLITDEFWGNYFKQDLHGVQGGAAPVVVGQEFDVDPYPTASVQEGFADMWCASLSHCMKRFEGKRATYKNIRSGGVGCFTVDSFPVFDYMRPNVYVIADSNHGYKMIGVGREVARVMTGGHSSVLYPFRFERFAGKRSTYKNVRSGGVGCFTADSFPIFDYMRPNVYVIADSNHGYKMIGVGREVAQVMAGGHSSVLYPFRFERFATGDLHPVSNSPYPWS